LKEFGRNINSPKKAGGKKAWVTNFFRTKGKGAHNKEGEKTQVQFSQGEKGNAPPPTAPKGT